MTEETFVCLDFECVECPPMCGVFSVHASEAEQKSLSPQNMPFRCPRGHAQTWTSYRCFLRLDEGGYPLRQTYDRRSIVAYLEREYKEGPWAGEAIFLMLVDALERGVDRMGP